MDLSGKTFGRWRVLSRLENAENKSFHLCVCSCGKEKKVITANLINGKTRSCGCLRKELLIKRCLVHGMKRKDFSFYSRWKGIVRRCTKPKARHFNNYGGRGIVVCSRWMNFINFMEDMYESYKHHVIQFGERNTLLDRIDVDGNYEKNNCRWITSDISAYNTRRSNGFKNKYGKYSAEIAKILNLSKSHVNYLNRNDLLSDRLVERSK